MSKKILILLTFLILQVASYRTFAAIGDWKAYMAYSEVQEIEPAGNLIFVQASNNLYVYNRNDQSIQTFSKVDYLSDCEYPAHRLQQGCRTPADSLQKCQYRPDEQQ